MRIAHLIDDLGCGGAEQVVAKLALSQSRDGHGVHVICLREIGANSVDVGALRAAGVQIVTLGKPPGFHLVTLRALKTHLERHRIDVLHTHNHLVHHYGAAASRWARKTAIVNTLHGTFSLRTSALWAKALFWSACLLSDRIVCVDRQVYEEFREAYPLPGARVVVIRNGVDLAPLLRLQRRSSTGVVTFGTIGRLDPVKGHAVLLQAFSLLKRTNPAIKLRVLGDGMLKSELRQQAERLSIEDDVSFEGFDLDTPSFLRDVEIYVMSSLSEGLPLTLLEAMGAGLPVVATAVGGITNLVTESGCGWLCAPGEPEALAEAMRAALRAPDRIARGARGRVAVQACCSVERMARQYQDLYDSLVT